MNALKNFLTTHAKPVLISGLILLVGAGTFGTGLFGSLGEGSDNFFASGTQSAKVSQKVTDIFGVDDTQTAVILLEAKDRTADVRAQAYFEEAVRVLEPLKTTSYYTTGSTQFISRDGHDTYAVATLSGTADEQYKAIMDFSESVKSDKFIISVGGTLVGQQQTLQQSKIDLRLAEMISLPILAVLLFWFFRGPIAAAIPLGMSLLTIAGALAVARIIHFFTPIDTYTLNVITILGVGLSIDYSLLAVNRFREELHAGHSTAVATKRTISTAGRTIFFSGLTVIICLLSLLLFPVGFMRSVSIGGASAVLVAVIISIFLLPPALRLIGKNIDRWSLKPRSRSSKGWRRVAYVVTAHPYLALIVSVVVIGSLVWPISSFQTKTFDWHVLPSNQSAYHVGRAMDERFDMKPATLTVLARFDTKPTVAQLCTLAKTVQGVEGVDGIQAAYVPNAAMPDCQTMPYVLAQLSAESPDQVARLTAMANQYIRGNYARIEVVPAYSTNDARINRVIDDITHARYEPVLQVEVTGQAARAQDTLNAYRSKLPYVVGIIIVAMVLILSILLGSVILPLQAVVINSLALFISLGVMIMIFQFGWGAGLLSLSVSGGFELSIPILIFVIAFGLSMDYAVFLYSRMHELYDLNADPKKAIIDGVTKTGPIITAAALLLFVVVSAFASSHIAIIQQIGVGLAVAVLVDAFFVRTVLVPAIMKLFGKASWWAPAWLKRLTVKHE